MNRRNFRTAVLAFVVAALVGGAPAWSASYTLDTQHSEIQFRVRHLGISTVTGQFLAFDGTLVFDQEQKEDAEVQISIDVASIDTGVDARDEHLRSPDFFNVAEFPEMSFSSTSVAASEDGLTVSGELTIRGVTRPVVLEAEFNGQVIDPWGNFRVGFTASSSIDRTDFGLVWNKVLETGGLLVSEEVEIVLLIEGIQQKDDADDSAAP